MSLPSLGGIAREGATLTADPGAWKGDAPITFTYAWEKCDSSGANCVVISGATGTTYVIPSTAPGSTLRVAVTATNSSGQATSRSFVSGVVSPAGTIPASANLPAVSGTIQQGKTLSATSGSWNGRAAITFAYAWQRCNNLGESCSSISSATGPTYMLTAADTGSTVRVAVTATNSSGVGKAYSGPTAVVASATAPAVSTLPTISGSAKEGQTLTASDGDWAGTTPITFSVEWSRCDSGGSTCVVIPSATAHDYALTAADVGHTVRASVTASNAAGSAAALTTASDVVASSSVGAPVIAAVPTLSGSPEVGATLSVTTGTWTGSTPLSYAYSWQSCDAAGKNCSTIGNADAATYSPRIGDLGRRLQAQVVASNSSGSASSVSSTTSPIASPKAPYNIAYPVIYASSTKLKEHDVVTASVGSWLGASPTSYTYQWTRCTGNQCIPIGGAKNASYTIAKADVGHPLFIQVKALNRYGSKFVNSQRTPAGISLQLRIAAAPTIAGSPVLGAKLSANPGTWVGSQAKQFSYQWTRCGTNGVGCAPIPGAKLSTYTTTTSDVGHPLFVQIKATSGGVSAFANSALTRPIAATAATGALQVGSVVLPNRLVISAARFQPTSIASRAPFVARFRVTDASGKPVQGALVYALGIPYAWVSGAHEVATDSTGWATTVVTPTAQLPLTGGTALVMFVRARKPGDNLLAGVSSRRLVQIVVGRRGLASAALGDREAAPLAVNPVPVTGVSLPNRLIVSDVKFTPRSIGSRAPITARFRVTDTAGHPVQGALVYALGLPYSWTYGAPEVATAADGWATIQIRPTALLPLERGTALVMFVRARKAGDNLLGGVSNRRLVQVVVR